MAAEAPHATGGNAAAHLAQLALQAVVERTRRQQSDPRMASLRSVGDLQQLWVGSRANYKWGGRQPLRRRRGDVHGDVSAVVLRLDWDGALTLLCDICYLHARCCSIIRSIVRSIMPRKDIAVLQGADQSRTCSRTHDKLATAA